MQAASLAIRRSLWSTFKTATTSITAAAFGFALAAPALAGDASPPPCTMPIAVALADRPGTGRTASTGGSPCVVLPGEIVIETGLRRQITTAPGSSVTLTSVPLTFVAPASQNASSSASHRLPTSRVQSPGTRRSMRPAGRPTSCWLQSTSSWTRAWRKDRSAQHMLRRRERASSLPARRRSRCRRTSG